MHENSISTGEGRESSVDRSYDELSKQIMFHESQLENLAEELREVTTDTDYAESDLARLQDVWNRIQRRDSEQGDRLLRELLELEESRLGALQADLLRVTDLEKRIANECILRRLDLATSELDRERLKLRVLLRCSNPAGELFVASRLARASRLQTRSPIRSDKNHGPSKSTSR